MKMYRCIGGTGTSNLNALGQGKTLVKLQLSRKFSKVVFNASATNKLFTHRITKPTLGTFNASSFVVTNTNVTYTKNTPKPTRTFTAVKNP